MIASRKFHVKAWKMTLHTRKPVVSPTSRFANGRFANVSGQFDEPLADEEWMKKYEEEVDETNKLEQELRERLEGSVQVDSW